jgi:molecular chaperone GrpE
MTYQGLVETLIRLGVTPVESTGRPFDPNFHEAVATEENTDVAANTVLSEFQKGYLFKDRLLRPAKVIVSKSPPSEE